MFTFAARRPISGRHARGIGTKYVRPTQAARQGGRSPQGAVRLFFGLFFWAFQAGRQCGFRVCGKPYTRARARLQRQGPSIYFQNNYFATLAAILAKEITDENQKGRARSRHSRTGRRECSGAGLGDAEKNQGHRRHFAGPPRIVDPVFLL
ncbi:hypothetical protein PT2222_160043 [Paraburkholderia tropica]